MKRIITVTMLVVCNLGVLCAQVAYSGKPYNGRVPVLPGKIQCEFYDLGGEGIAFHDLDSVNGGSGHLNPVNGNYLHEFRMNETVGISYTKSNEIDNSPYNFFNPEMDQLYVGWTHPNEWIKYTVEVQKSGNYIIGTMYTANGKGAVAFSIDDQPANIVIIPSTHRDDDPVDWRQWHHWNKLDSIAQIYLPEGKHIIKLDIVENGNMNFDFFEVKFKR